MDLRFRLVAYLAAFSAVLFAVVLLVLASSLGRDVEEEVRASSRLADVLLAAAQAGRADAGPGAAVALQRLLEEGALRHVRVSLEQPGSAPMAVDAPELPAWIARLLRTEPPALREHRLPLADGGVLVIRPDPASEAREIAHDGSRLLLILFLYTLASIGAAWLAAHRALAPVRALEEGLSRLGRGLPSAGLPSFRLKEFARIGRAIDGLATSLERARRSERRLARRLISVQESERRELARDLHDEIGQSLAAISAAGAYVQRHAAGAAPEQLAECGADVVREARRIASHVSDMLGRLRPHGLDGLGLLDALRDLITSWQQRATGLTIQAVLPEQLPVVGEGPALALYRALQEALTNVVRHSGATRCRVRLAVADGQVGLTVTDDGVGRAAEVLDRAGGGIPGMRERIEMVGGSLELSDAVPKGLTQRESLPQDETRRSNDQDPAGG